MLQCISFKSSSATTSLQASPPTVIDPHANPSPSQGNSTEFSAEASTHPSPNVNHTWDLATHSNSYFEMLSKIHVLDSTTIDHHNHDESRVDVHVEHINGDDDPHQMILSQVLQPNRECVNESLRHAKPNTLTRLISSYFDQSENATHLCLILYQNIYRARAIYTPLYELLDVLPTNHHAITQPQCNCTFELFIDFDRHENPFPCPDSRDFHDMRHCFSTLRQQLDRNLRKSHSRVRLFRGAVSGSALCISGTAIAVTVSALAIATHALVAIVAGPLCTAYVPRNPTKRELAHMAQLDAAAKGTYVLNNDLDTIDRLVARLYTSIEGDKLLVRLGLERGTDKHSIQEVVKQLRKNQSNFSEQLKDLEEHICLCFNSVNRARSLLLQEIHLHQTR